MSYTTKSEQFKHFQNLRGKSFEINKECFYGYMGVKGFPELVRILKAQLLLD